MNTAKEYVIAELEDFIKSFSNVRVRYEFDKKSETHFVEIIPNEVYRLDEKYLQWESEFFDTFIDKYPTQNICFISDDALVGIEHADLELYGIDYQCISAFSQPLLLKNITVPVRYSNSYSAMIDITFCDLLEQEELSIPDLIGSAHVVDSNYSYTLAA